jgi:uncharacterized Zn-finger protein
MNFTNIISNSESLLCSDSCFETPVIGIINDLSESPSKASEDVEYTQILDDGMLDYIIKSDHSPMLFSYSSNQLPVPDMSKLIPFHDMSNHYFVPDLSDKHRGRRRTKVIAIQQVHTCGECGWTFLRKHDLKRHMYRHNGVFPYKCHCGKGYYRKDAFLNHKRKCSKV